MVITACTGEPPTDLGVKNGKLSHCPSTPNCVSSEAADQSHEIAPLRFSGSPRKAFKRLKTILTNREDVTLVIEKPDYLRVEFHTRLFTDDGEFLLGKDRIEVRSASRIGYSDLGKNRQRIEDIRKAFSFGEEGRDSKR